MKVFSFNSEVFLPRQQEEIFAFFSDAGNLELLTPPWLNFAIFTPRPLRMKVGTRIDYRLKLHGVPIRWQSEITEWEPPLRFVDDQRRGPYRLWTHEHIFQSFRKGTLVADHVRYAVYGGVLVRKLFVAPDLKKIFSYRRQKLQEIFEQSESDSLQTS